MLVLHKDVFFAIKSGKILIEEFPNLLKTMEKSSIIMTTIGFIGCALYTILNYQERSAQDGEI